MAWTDCGIISLKIRMLDRRISCAPMMDWQDSRKTPNADQRLITSTLCAWHTAGAHRFQKNSRDWTDCLDRWLLPDEPAAPRRVISPHAVSACPGHSRSLSTSAPMWAGVRSMDEATSQLGGGPVAGDGQGGRGVPERCDLRRITTRNRAVGGRGSPPKIGSMASKRAPSALRRSHKLARPRMTIMTTLTIF